MRIFSSLVVNQINILFISLFLIACTFFSAIIPPFQSVDEYDHIKRSYLLSKGTIILDHSQGKSSGGMIDSGLLEYMNAYPVTADKLTFDAIDSAELIKWSGSKVFSQAPGTGFYFPLIYTPQAIGLAIGEKFGLTVDYSYRLARMLTLISIGILLLLSFSIYPTNPLAIALILIPMSIFQYSSASLDGISTSLSFFSISAFLRILKDKKNASRLLYCALSISVILLATSRVHLLPFLTFTLIPCIFFKEKKYYVISFFAFAGVLLWLIIAIKTTIDLRISIGTSTSNIILYYFRHPFAFFHIILSTLSDDTLLTYYYHSFIGILGWPAASFEDDIYNIFLCCLIIIGILSLSIKNLKIEWRPRLFLLILSFTSIVLIFFALLVTWSAHPAVTISGIQGRYFLIPMIIASYAISDGIGLYEGYFRRIALFLCVVLFLFTITNTTRLLLDRYYIAPEKPDPSSLSIKPSAPLSKSTSIAISFSDAHKTTTSPLSAISINFGTYARNNSGSAELFLTDKDGHTTFIPFDLYDLKDNKYRHFNVAPSFYSNVVIRSLSGEGVSIWEAHDAKGAISSCVIYEYADGTRSYTRGCPKR